MHSLSLAKPDGRPARSSTAATPIPEALDAPSPNPNAAPPELPPALAPAARRVGRLRGPPAEPHVPAAAGVQPARADARPGAPDRSAGGAVGRRGLREPLPDAHPRSRAHDPPATIVDTRPGRGACEVVVFTQDADARRSARCRSTHLELLLRGLGATATASSGRATTWSTCSRSRTAASRWASRCTTRTGRSTPTRSCRRSRRASWPSSAALLRRARPRAARGHSGARDRATAGACSTPGEHAVAFVPVVRALLRTRCGSRRAARPPRSPTLDAATSARDLARALKTVLLKYDGLWQRPFPYIMVVPPGADRRARRIPRRTCTSSSTRPTACRTG